MAKARALDKRRKSIRNIRKITRTMELIATGRFKKAMDRASAATAYTKRMSMLVADLAQSGLKVSHPLLEPRPETKNAILLVLSANRGLCGGYNANITRVALARWNEWKNAETGEPIFGRKLEISGKRSIAAFRFRKVEPDVTYTNFEDRPAFDEVEPIANRYLAAYAAGELDRLDVAYTRFESAARQFAVVETLLPLGSLAGADKPEAGKSEVAKSATSAAGGSPYEFYPSAESILEEVVPASFKIKLFKAFLDAAVSEQIARMVAMKTATENADELIRDLSMTYNRARQGQITSELLDVIGGVEALNN